MKSLPCSSMSRSSKCRRNTPGFHVVEGENHLTISGCCKTCSILRDARPVPFPAASCFPVDSFVVLGWFHDDSFAVARLNARPTSMIMIPYVLSGVSANGSSRLLSSRNCLTYKRDLTLSPRHFLSRSCHSFRCVQDEVSQSAPTHQLDNVRRAFAFSKVAKGLASVFIIIVDRMNKQQARPCMCAETKQTMRFLHETP